MTVSNKKITLKELAAMVGVSQAAVSGVLNNSSKIKCGHDKRKKILELAQKYNYAPNSSARALAVGRTGQIGFLVDKLATLGLGNAYFGRQLSGVEQVASKYEYLTMVSTCDLTDISKFVFPEKLKRRSVDGIIVAGPVLPEIIDVLRNVGVPSIICCNPAKSKAEKSMHLGDHQIFLSYNGSMNTLLEVETLRRLGHRKICLSSLWEGLPSSIPDNCELIHELLHDSDTFQQGTSLARKWYETPRRKRFTALLACDQFCYGFLRTLNSIEPGLCPREVSVICAAELEMHKYIYPSLSSMTCDPFEYGRLSTEMLIDLIDKKRPFESLVEDAIKFYKQKHEVIVRESIGPAPKDL